MIDLHLTRGDNYEGVYLRLPATPAEVGEAYVMLDSISRYAGETHIVDVKSPVKNLAQFIKNADLAKQEDLEKLNYLAEKIRSMSVNEQTLFSGALWTESMNSLDDVLRVADRLEDYEIIPEVTCDRELGGYVVEHGLVMDFPEAVRPYDALQITILNRNDGQVDSLRLRFADVLGKKQVSNPNFRNGISPYAWTDSGQTEWYVYKPNAGDYQKLSEALGEYLELFQEQTQAPAPLWQQTM